jgi:starch-binding outer membrane protein, SusD/RagB family
MTKKILYIITAILIFSTSCKEEWLDVSPSDALSPENAFTTVKDAQTALFGVYSELQEEGYYSADLISYGAVKGDACRTFDGGRRTENAYIFTETTDASSTGLWTIPYTAIMLTNNILERIDDLNTLNDEEAAQKNSIKGQALALRALCYFDLVRVHGRMPENGSPGTDLGVPLVLEVLKPEAAPARATVAEVYAQVILDLQTAIPLLSTEVSEGVFNRYAAEALLGRVYLYYNDNSNALSYSESVINSNAYQLLTTSNYSTSWDGTTTSETILEVVNTLSDSPQREGIYYLWWPDPDGYGAICLTNSMISTLQSDPTDVRSTLVQDLRGDGGFSYLAKWSTTYDCNIQLIRLSEVYLNACEAAFKSNEMTKALTYINTLVENRTGVADTYTTLTLQTILDERNKELVGEGHRFFDLMRNGLTMTRTGADHLATAPMSMSPNDYRAIQPIPRLETRVNPNIIQNPEY